MQRSRCRIFYSVLALSAPLAMDAVHLRAIHRTSAKVEFVYMLFLPTKGLKDGCMELVQGVSAKHGNMSGNVTLRMGW